MELGKSGINQHEFTFRITGYTPLLMHNPKGMVRAGSLKMKAIPTPEEEAESGLYVDEHDKLFVPFVMLRNCALGGGRGQKIRKESLSSFLAGTILNVDLDSPCYLFNPETGEQLTRKDYVIDTRRAVVQKQGVQRSRPKIQKWATYVTFSADVSQVSRVEDYAGVLATALGRGGQLKGIADYRPEKGGPFGRFTVELAD